MRPRVRNVAIVLGVAAVGVVARIGFAEAGRSIPHVLAVAWGLVGGYVLYRALTSGDLFWYGVPRLRRYVLVACGAGIAAVLVGVAVVLLAYPRLKPHLGVYEIVAIVSGLAFTLAWIIKENRLRR